MWGYQMAGVQGRDKSRLHIHWCKEQTRTPSTHYTYIK